MPVWELTNAIETGDVPGALDVLHRLLHATGPQQPKPMHPLQIMGMLHDHYRRLARLDDPRSATRTPPSPRSGGRVKQYPATKALRAVARARHGGLRDAFDAPVPGRPRPQGRAAIPPEAVMEVLVARLAGLSGGSRSGRTGGAASVPDREGNGAPGAERWGG